MFRLILLSLVLALCTAAKTLAEDQTQALIERGYALTQAGELDAALTILQQAMQKDPDSSLIHTRLGGVRLLRQEYSEGIRDFQQAITLDQSNAAAFIGMAVAYLHLGQHRLARAALDEAAKLDPSKQAEIDKVVTWLEQRNQEAGPVD